MEKQLKELISVDEIRLGFVEVSLSYVINSSIVLRHRKN